MIKTASRTGRLLTNGVLLLRVVIAFVCRIRANSSLSGAHLESLQPLSFSDYLFMKVPFPALLR